MASWPLKTVLALVFFSIALARAQTALPPDLPIDEWLRGPDRQDFPWKVQIREPWLTFQQRHTVQVRAGFRLRELRKHGLSADDLHLVLKVAGPDGQWVPGEAYSPLQVKPEYGDEIETVATFYARPGKYKLALMAYDVRNRRGNLWRGGLTVAGVKADPLPDADRSLPIVQFLPQVSAARPSRFFGTHRVVFDASALGQGKLTLPVANERPLQIDIVANLSLSDATYLPGRHPPDWLYKINADTLLQISNVLSQLDVKKGCVRFSAVDILREKAFVEREDAAKVDWDKVVKHVQDLQQVKIEARVLASQKQTAEIFAKFTEQLLDEPGCQFQEPPLHILVMVGDAFTFPNGTALRPLRVRHENRGYYFKLMPVGAGNWDQVESILKPLHPIRFEFSNSLRFRQALASLISKIQDASLHDKAGPPAGETMRSQP